MLFMDVCSIALQYIYVCIMCVSYCILVHHILFIWNLYGYLMSSF